jgi:hypothetical protein
MRLAHANETRGTPTKRQVAIGRLALGIDDLDLEPVDRHSIVPAAQWHRRQPAVTMDETLPAALDELFKRRQLDAR